MAVIAIPNRRLRAAFRKTSAAHGYSQGNTLDIAATEAAYREGGPWLDALKAYLEGNLDALRRALAPTPFRLVEPQSTYLVLVDCRDLGLSDDGLRKLVEDDAGLWLDLGDIFGADVSGFIRINIAAPRSVVAQAARQLVEALAARA